jgi:hypothetical protein
MYIRGVVRALRNVCAAEMRKINEPVGARCIFFTPKTSRKANPGKAFTEMRGHLPHFSRMAFAHHIAE